MKFGKWIVNNFWLKIISLALAVITWFYVINAIEETTDKKTMIARILPSYNKIITKKLYVEAIFTGELPAGYELMLESVKVDPGYFVVAGPKYILEKVEKLQTIPIDISKYKRTIIYDGQLSPIANTIDTDKLLVKVTIPIKKIENGTKVE